MLWIMTKCGLIAYAPAPTARIAGLWKTKTALRPFLPAMTKMNNLRHNSIDMAKSHYPVAAASSCRETLLL